MTRLDQETALWNYRKSFYSFFLDAWKVLEPQTPLVVNWHMKYLCDELSEILHQVRQKKTRDRDLIINIPPATTKSTLVTIIFPVWAWLWAPHLKVLNMSHDASLAIAHAVRSRDLIQSEWFQELFGWFFSLKYDVNKKSEFATDKGGIRVAFGVGQAPVGKHGDLIICDDPIDPIKAVSDVHTEKVNTWWDRSVSTRLTNPDVSTKIVVMQRLSKKDLTGHCITQNPDLYKHICLPAEESDNIKPATLRRVYKARGGLLSPIRLSPEILAKFRKTLGSIGYAGQYRQDPVAEGGNLIKHGWIGTWTWDEIEKRRNDFDQQIIWNVYIDGAYTQDELNAPTGIMVAAGVGGWCFVRHVERAWMELPELIKRIPMVCKEHGYTDESYIYVEPKASGLSIIQMLERYTTLNVLSDKPPRAGKVERTKANLPFYEAGHLRTLVNAPWTGMYLGELESFPFSDYADLTDITNMAIDHVDRGGVGGGAILSMATI